MTHCDVICDLLPLYAENLSSEESNRLIDTHLACCDSCRAVLQRMKTSMEPEAIVQDREILQTLRRQKQKQHRRILLACTLTLFFCVIGWWLCMEFRFRTDTGHLVSADAEKILTEMPDLALSESELKLAQTLWEQPTVQNALGTTKGTELQSAELMPTISDALPENVSQCTVFVLHGNVTIEYRHENHHVFLEYLGGYDTEKPAVIRKTIGLTDSKAGKSSGVVYVQEYVMPLEQTRYEKYRTKHVWFAFLEEL